MFYRMGVGSVVVCPDIPECVRVKLDSMIDDGLKCRAFPGLRSSWATGTGSAMPAITAVTTIPENDP